MKKKKLSAKKRLNTLRYQVGVWGQTGAPKGVGYVQWETMNGYLQRFGFSQRVGKDDFIPENKQKEEKITQLAKMARSFLFKRYKTES